MKDHEKRELVTRLCAVARDYHPTEQLRDRIADLVLPALDSVERYMAHEGGAVVAEVAQRFADEAEGLRMQVQALELAYSQCMARQAQRAADPNAPRAPELERACRLLCEAALVERNPDRFVAPPAFAPAIRAAMLALRPAEGAPASDAIDWGAVDDELRESLNMVCATDAWNRKGAEDKLRALLRRVSGQ